MSAYVVHGVTLTLAWFAAANLLASVLVAVAARRALADATRRAPWWWLALRCLPSAASLTFVAVVFVPSYLRFEPRETIEGFDVTLTAGAAAALILVLLGAARGCRAWRRAARQADVWMQGAQPLAARATGVPVYTIRSMPAPLMALVGIRAPRVLVSDRLLGALTAAELDATIAHETSHARSSDNLKRLILRLLPDALAGTRTAAALEQRWASAAEHAADCAATAGSAAARCALASALVKAARLIPRAPAPLEPISTLVGGDDLSSRVESLLGEPSALAAPTRALCAGASVVAVAIVAYAPMLRAVHEITEILVNSLP